MSQTIDEIKEIHEKTLISIASNIATAIKAFDGMVQEITRLQAELIKYREKATFKLMEISSDGERFCPACDQEIAGYYALYCEHCGQAIEEPDEDADQQAPNASRTN